MRHLWQWLMRPSAALSVWCLLLIGWVAGITFWGGFNTAMADLSTDYERLFEEIEKQAASGAPNADTLYTIAATSAFLSADAAAEGGRGAGTLLAATGLEVLERHQGALRVRLDGWQQDGVDRVIYALKGRRIFEGTFRPEAVDVIERLETVVDPDTDLTWHRVGIDLWVRPEGLIADQQMLWDYGRAMHIASCSTCHSLHNSDEYLANQWIEVVDGKERFITLDRDQTQMLQKYLQMHASDVAEVASDG